MPSLLLLLCNYYYVIILFILLFYFIVLFHVLHNIVLLFYYFARGRGGEVLWYVRYVCVSVCRPGYLRNHMRDLYQFFCAWCLWPWLGPLPEVDEIPRGRGSFRGFSPYWKCIVMRWLKITSCSSRRDHSFAAGGDGSAQRTGAKCDLWLPCFIINIGCIILLFSALSYVFRVYYIVINAMHCHYLWKHFSRSAAW